MNEVGATGRLYKGQDRRSCTPSAMDNILGDLDRVSETLLLNLSSAAVEIEHNMWTKTGNTKELGRWRRTNIVQKLSLRIVIYTGKS